MGVAHPAGGRGSDAQGTLSGGPSPLFRFIHAGSLRAGHARPLHMVWMERLHMIVIVRAASVTTYGGVAWMHNQLWSDYGHLSSFGEVNGGGSRLLAGHARPVQDVVL